MIIFHYITTVSNSQINRKEHFLEAENFHFRLEILPTVWNTEVSCWKSGPPYLRPYERRSQRTDDLASACRQWKTFDKQFTAL
jgi:hypothetical protein